MKLMKLLKLVSVFAIVANFATAVDAIKWSENGKEHHLFATLLWS